MAADRRGEAGPPPAASPGAAGSAAGYWRRRERAARELAARAGEGAIARLHLDMAERYAALAGRAEAGE